MTRNDVLCVLVAICLMTGSSRGEWLKLKSLAHGEGTADCNSVESPLDSVCDAADNCDALGLCESEVGCSEVGCSEVGCSEVGCSEVGCSAAGCSDISACDCLVCCDQWTFLAEAMFLRRSDADQLALIRHQETGETLLDAENLEFNHNAAVRYQLIREYCNCWGWDIGFFGIDSWTSSGNGGGPVSPVLTGPGIDFQSTQHGTIFRAEYGTDLYSAEFNIRRRCHEWVTAVAGFRWMELRDELRTLSIAPQVEDFYTIDTNNQMYGFQLGADSQLWDNGKRLRLDGIFRAGILFNNADQHTSAPILTPFVPSVVDEISARDDHTAFLGEVGLRGGVRVYRNWYATGGYAFMLLDGLALAPDQLPHTNMVVPASATLDTGGTLYFHGATVGLMGTF